MGAERQKARQGANRQARGRSLGAFSTLAVASQKFTGLTPVRIFWFLHGLIALCAGIPRHIPLGLTKLPGQGG
jgi:hypothetical protein